MQQTEDIGCLTQRSQLDRLQELADGITRERVKSLQSSDLLATIVLVIGPSGKESTWDLDHLPMARSATEPARSEEHTSELQSLAYLVCRLLLEKKNQL